MNRLPNNPLPARALEIAHRHLGLRELSARLGVPETIIEAWRAGYEEIPNEKFLLLVDLLTRIDPLWSRGAVAASTPKRILIVDDHPDTADSLAALLELDGHEVVSVIDPRGAVAAAKLLRPNLALLDLRMPHIDGLKLAQMIRSEPELKHTCLVAVTAETEPAFAELTRRAGFDAYLRKPVDLAMLRSVVAQFGN